MTYENIKFPTTPQLPDTTWIYTIDAFMKPLVEQLALKYPQWTFNGVSVAMDNQKKEAVVYRFKIIDRREELGAISKEWTRNGNRYLVDNHRIDSMRERGRGMKTIHLDKAVKHVSKYFSKKNLNEKLREADKLARESLERVGQTKGWRMRELWNNHQIGMELQKYLVSVFPHALTMLDPNIASKLEDFPIRVNELHESLAMSEKLLSNNMHLVLLDGMDYAIQKGNEPPTIKASEQLPEYMRKAIGLLKLVEDNQIMQDIGFRVNANTFFVVNKEEV